MSMILNGACLRPGSSCRSGSVPSVSDEVQPSRRIRSLGSSSAGVGFVQLNRLASTPSSSPSLSAASIPSPVRLPSQSIRRIRSLGSSSAGDSFVQLNRLASTPPSSPSWSAAPIASPLSLPSQSSRPSFASAASRFASSSGSPVTESEEVFFDGGVHFGDLAVNLVFGFTLVWLPLTLTAVFRNLFLRYRFTNLRVTVQSGVLGGDRKDFSYNVVKGVKVVPRFIGEWGDMAIELKDGTSVDIRCVPKFREIAKYIEERAAGTQNPELGTAASSPAREGSRKKGFS